MGVYIRNSKYQGVRCLNAKQHLESKEPPTRREEEKATYGTRKDSTGPGWKKVDQEQDGRAIGTEQESQEGTELQTATAHGNYR